MGESFFAEVTVVYLDATDVTVISSPSGPRVYWDHRFASDCRDSQVLADLCRTCWFAAQDSEPLKRRRIASMLGRANALGSEKVLNHIFKLSILPRAEASPS